MPSALAAALIVTPSSSRLSPMSSPGCGGFFISMDHRPSMIVDKVDVRSAAVGKAEDDSPIRTYRNGPKAIEVAFQGMQPQRGQIKRFDRLRGVQYRQDLLNLTHVIRIDPLGIVIFEQS